MRRIDQDGYQEPQNKIECLDEPLLIHSKAPEGRRNLVIFVHGLRGTRYGYWGQMPRFIFEDLPDTDVGLYYYKTATRRLGLSVSVELETEAVVLADELRRLKSYKSITIIGHSMGGILAKAAVCSLLDRGYNYALRKMAGLILIAVPQIGSLRVPRFLRILSADARALSPHNSFISRIDRTFLEKLSIEKEGDPRGRDSVPVWAIVAAEDFWVDSLSARIGIPERQTLLVRGSHGSVITPSTKDVLAYRFVLDCLDTTASVGDDEPELTQQAATVDDVDAIRQIAISMFGDEVTDEATLLAFVDSQRILGTVKRIIRTLGEKRERFVGYWCLIPLSAAVAARVKAGELRGSEICMKDIDITAPSALYVGAVAAIDYTSKGMVVDALRKRFEDLGEHGVSEVLARPITRDGLRLAKRRGFRPVDPSRAEIGDLFATNLAALLKSAGTT